MKLKNYNTKANLFFKMLPNDWQETIVPHWNKIKRSTVLYVLIEDKHIVAGGLVFSACPPDMKYYEKEANVWFNKDYLYLGFIYVDATKRNRNLGSMWLDKVKQMYPKQGFWLAIEDEQLHKFYTINGFKKMASVVNNDSQEEFIYTFEP
jgi:GNAT superfamily N-acetyltransferase